MGMQPDSFGDWLKYRRKTLDLTQADLADRVGCATSTIRKLEAEERLPSVQIIARLADIFNIPATERPAFQKFARRGSSYSSMNPGQDLAEQTKPWQSLPEQALPSSPTAWVSDQSSSQSSRTGRNPLTALKLPWPATALIGREPELTRLQGYLADPAIRLVTLVGPPGIGKTRLSIEVARLGASVFEDGAVFVALGDLVDPERIAAVVLRTLGIEESPDTLPHEQLVSSLREKRLLLVLDNCEHLIDNVAALVSQLLGSCFGLKILATSRESLRVPGEWLHNVPPLTLPDAGAALELESVTHYSAVALFVERARAVQADFKINPDNLQAVAAICARLDGLPLGIEMIAARVRLLPPAALLDRLDGPMLLSADGRRPGAARQKTLQAAIQWSYRLLSAEEQRLLAYLSVFLGGFTWQASEALLQYLFADRSSPELVASLLDKSLLQGTLRQSPGSEAPPSVLEPRFHMLVTIQQFAANVLHEMGEEQAAQDWRLSYFLDLAETADREIHGPNQIHWLDRIEAEHDNIRAALLWGIATQQTAPTLRLLAALGWSWQMRNHLRELWEFFDKVRYLPDRTAYPLHLACLLTHFGRISWIEDDFLTARKLLEESRDILIAFSADGESGWETILADTLSWLGLTISRGDQDYAQASALIHRSLELYQHCHNPWGIASSTLHLGLLEKDWDHPGPALAWLEQALGLFLELGDLLALSRVFVFLEDLSIAQGDEDRARLFLEQHLSLSTELQNWDGIIMDLRELANHYRRLGNYEQAGRLCEQSLDLCYRHNLDPYHSLAVSALIAFDRHEDALASLRFSQQLELARKSGQKSRLSLPLAGLASLAGRAGQTERAIVLFGAALVMAEMYGAPLPPVTLAEFDPSIQSLREQWGQTAFETLVAKGRVMTTEQAVAYALDNDQ